VNDGVGAVEWRPLDLKLGGQVEVSQSSFDAMAATRDWLLEATRELEDVTVTPSPPPGDPWKVGM
jgi:hypothetical protein